MTENSELEILQRLVPELEAEGYEVYLQPNKAIIPLFLGTYQPDAIALRADKNLIIEVLRRSPEASKKLERITSLLDARKGWGLKAVWIEPVGDQRTLKVQTQNTIQARIKEIKQIAVDGHLQAATLMAWATFEALARAILIEQFSRPQTPARLVQILAAGGDSNSHGSRSIAQAGRQKKPLGTRRPGSECLSART